MQVRGNSDAQFKGVYPHAVLKSATGEVQGIKLKLTDIDKRIFNNLVDGDIVTIFRDKSQRMDNFAVVKREFGDLYPFDIKHYLMVGDVKKLLDKVDYTSKNAKNYMLGVNAENLLNTPTINFGEFLKPTIDSVKEAVKQIRYNI